jgi:hypothetical protein
MRSKDTDNTYTVSSNLSLLQQGNTLDGNKTTVKPIALSDPFTKGAAALFTRMSALFTRMSG